MPQRVHCCGGIWPFEGAPERLISGHVSAAPDHPQACPICGKPAVARFRPFCSPRCKDVDLHRWFTGAYAVPGEALEELPEAAELLRAAHKDDDRG